MGSGPQRAIAICQWRWHSSVRWENFWPAERWARPQYTGMVGPGACVHLFICMSDGRDGGEVWAGWACSPAVEALEPLGTWLYKQLRKETEREKKRKNQFERSTTKNEKQMLKSTQGYEDASFRQGSWVVFNFLSRLPKGYIIQLHCLVMDKENSDSQVRCRYSAFFVALGWPFSSSNCLASLQSSLRML